MRQWLNGFLVGSVAGYIGMGLAWYVWATRQ